MVMPASMSLRVALFAVIAGTTPALTEAQGGTDSTRADSVSRRLRPVTVTESRAAAVVGGASALIVTTDKLRSSPAPLLDQLLRETPSVSVRQNSRGEMELTVRGSDSRQVAVILDGVPLTLGWDHRTDPSLVPITGSEEVVIVRGLGSLLSGPNALGGTISVSQGSTGFPAGDRRAWGGVGLDATAAFVTSIGASRTDSLGRGLLTTRAGMAYRQRDGVALASGITDLTARDGLRTNSDLRATDAFASLRWRGRSGRSIGATFTGFDAVRGVPPEEHLAAPRLWRYPHSTRGVAAISASSGAFATPFGFATADISAGYNAGRQKIESFTSRTYATLNGEELGDERTTTTRAHFTHTLPRGAKLAAAVTAADVRYNETLSPAAGVHYRQILSSAGLELETPLGASTTLAVGGVADKSRTPESGGREPGQAPLGDIGWRAGLVREVGTAWRLHANASRRSRFPALRELYSGALNRYRPNPDLKPETLLGLEGGVTVHGSVGAIPEASLQFTAFSHNLDDAIVRITQSNPTRFLRINRDRIESRGIELVSGATFGGGRDQAISVSADATIQTITVFDQTANGATRHSENNPEVRGAFGVAVPLPMQIRAFGTARYTGAQYCLHAESGAEVRLKGQAASDLSLERTFGMLARGPFRTMKALLALDNVANAAVYDQCGLPQPGRTLRFMLTLR